MFTLTKHYHNIGDISTTTYTSKYRNWTSCYNALCKLVDNTNVTNVEFVKHRMIIYYGDHNLEVELRNNELLKLIPIGAVLTLRVGKND